MPTDILISIEKDGTVSIKTGEISDTHHLSADAFLDEIESLLGGSVDRRKLEHPLLKNKNVLRGGKIVKA
jgi:hypothetical protein